MVVFFADNILTDIYLEVPPRDFSIFHGNVREPHHTIWLYIWYIKPVKNGDIGSCKWHFHVMYQNGHLISKTKGLQGMTFSSTEGPWGISG